MQVSRIDLMVKKAILLEAEAHQMVFDQARKWREEVDRRGATQGTSQVDMTGMVGKIDRLDVYRRKIEEAFELFKEASKLDPTNTEILLHVYQTSILASDDERERDQILYRIQSLLKNPKNDTEQFHLAQAIYLSAGSGDLLQVEQFRTARSIFERLGRADWVRRCDEQIALAGSHAGGVAAQQGFAQMPVHGAARDDGGIDPIGTWQVADSSGGLVFIEFRSDGIFNGVHQAGQFSNCQIAGQWAFGSAQQLLQMQGVMNGQAPFLTLIVFRAQQDGLYIGQDADGVVFYFRRIS